MVFKVLSLKRSVSSLLVSVLRRVSFWTGSLSKSVNSCNERFRDFNVKKYLILCAKQNKSGSEGSAPVFNRVAK